MPKTDITKLKSEDLKELNDEALDRLDSSLLCMKGPWTEAPNE